MHLKLFLVGLTFFLILQSVMLAIFGFSIGFIVVAGIVTLVVAQVLQLCIVFLMIARETQARHESDGQSDEFEAASDADIQPVSSR